MEREPIGIISYFYYFDKNTNTAKSFVTFMKLSIVG